MTDASKTPRKLGSRTLLRLPSQPVGLYDEEWSTEQHAASDLHGNSGHDTSPAPAGDLPSFATHDWTDDGPTLHSPLLPDPAGPDPEASWDDDQTVVVDPKRSHGS